MVRSALLVFPIDCPSLGLEGPRYGEVVSTRGGSAKIRILQRADADRALMTTISAATVTARQVPRAELQAGQPGLLLFRPVYASYEGVFRHGQITGYHNGIYDFHTAVGTHEVPYNVVVEVAPVLVLLLWSAELQPPITSSDELDTAHGRILDRLLGQNGQRATKSIPKLLTDIVLGHSVPRPTDQIPWRCPQSGNIKNLQLGGVVNYAFYKDGNRSVPSNIHLGETYSDSPSATQSSTPTRPARTVGSTRLRQRSRASAETTTSGVPGLQEDAQRTSQPTAQSPGNSDDEDDTDPATRFSDLLNAIANDQPVPKRRRTAATPPVPPVVPVLTSNPPTTPSAQPPPIRTQQILGVLAPHPELLSAYASQLQQLHATEMTPWSASGNNSLSTSPQDRAVHFQSASDLIPASDHTDKSNQSFRPSRSQQEVHNVITSPSYVGKHADVYMDHVRTSEATKFLAHPAISSRLYDFQFGVCDLSVLHFPRFDLHSQLDRTTAKAVNMRNFSAKVELPPIPESPKYSDLTEQKTLVNN